MKSQANYIAKGQIYAKPQFKEIVGWGEHAFRFARRRGLKVKHTAGRCYILGDDFIEYVEDVEQDSVSTKS